MTIASRITEAREKLGLKPAEFARRLGVTSQSVSQWESGATEPTKENLNKIARLTGETVDRLLSGVSTTEPDVQGAHEFRGRVVPMLEWHEITGDDPPGDGGGRVYARSNFPCGARSFMTVAIDDANEDRLDGRRSIYQGDAMIIDPDYPVKPGCMLLLRHRDETKVRQYRPRSDHVLLVPLNEAWDEIKVDSLSAVNVLGVIVETGRSRV